MDRIILQVPMKKELRDKATIAAKNNGFSSLQEAIRILLVKLAKKEITLRVEEKEEQLSPRQIKKYNRIIEQIKNGTMKTIPFDSTKDLMDYLS
jgi:hypothetical protein